MTKEDSLGFRKLTFGQPDEAAVVRVIVNNPINRIMSFLGLSIHDVVNCRIAKNKVKGYYRLTKWMDREADRAELEKQWNPLGRRS